MASARNNCLIVFLCNDVPVTSLESYCTIRFFITIFFFFQKLTLVYCQGCWDAYANFCRASCSSCSVLRNKENVIEIFLHILLKVLTNCIVIVAQIFQDIFTYNSNSYACKISLHHTYYPHESINLHFFLKNKQTNLTRPDYSHVVSSNLNWCNSFVSNVQSCQVSNICKYYLSTCKLLIDLICSNSSYIYVCYFSVLSRDNTIVVINIKFYCFMSWHIR